MDNKPKWLAVRILVIVSSLSLVALYIFFQSKQSDPAPLQDKVAMPSEKSDDTTEAKIDQPHSEDWVFPGSKSAPVKIETLPGSKSMILDSGIFGDEPEEVDEPEPEAGSEAVK